MQKKIRLNDTAMDVLRRSDTQPNEIVEVLPGVTVKYHPPRVCAGLYHLRFTHDDRTLDAFVQLGGGLQGAAYKGTTDVIDNQIAYCIIETELDLILKQEQM